MPMVLVIALAMGFAEDAGMASPLEVHTADGRTVDCSISLPAGNQRVPCFVVAPGRGYDKNRPIFADLIVQGARAGFAVVTFNWRYYTAGREPSKGFTDEIEDMTAVVRAARNHPRIDSGCIAAGGKSLGSAIAARVFASDDSMAALVLLTPVIPNEAAAAQNYPGLLVEERPVLVVVGENDEASCPLRVLYSTLSEAVRSIPVVVVGGDHGLNIGSPESPATSSNITMGNAAIVQWLGLWMRR